MSEFKPGEIAIFVGLPDMTGKDIDGRAGVGSECQLVSPCLSEYGPGWYCMFPGDPCPGTPDGSWKVPEIALRKRRPPESYKDQFTPASKDFNWREPVKGEVVA